MYMVYIILHVLYSHQRNNTVFDVYFKDCKDQRAHMCGARQLLTVSAPQVRPARLRLVRRKMRVEGRVCVGRIFARKMSSNPILGGQMCYR